ncbi:hypothetical protein Tco_1080619 [Tanacetum coccineum]|uniref:Reverse transcriptase domain-containing protein n=1 Tax=Tanacetum coccineum TaxID=301880 RepID=A0ABQ5HW41_9ASTR
MPPKRFKKKSVRKIVEKRVAKAIEKYEKTRADSNNTGGSGSANTGGTDIAKKREARMMEQELWTLTLKGDDIEAYNNRFHELALMCHELVPTEKKKIKSPNWRKDLCWKLTQNVIDQPYIINGPCPPKVSEMPILGSPGEDCRVRLSGNQQNDRARRRAYVVVENLQQNPNVVTAGEKNAWKTYCIRDFPKVFPDDLLGLPLVREIEFHIDLIPGASPVVRSPYRLALSKILELSNQLKELQEKDFIRPSHSPCGSTRALVQEGKTAEEEHEAHLKTILDLTPEGEFVPKFSKVRIMSYKNTFPRTCGHRNGIHVDPSKVESVKNWKTPESSTKIHLFLGLARDKKDEAFTNSEEATKAKLLCYTPHGPDDFVAIVMHQNKVFGCMLMQRGSHLKDLKAPTEWLRGLETHFEQRDDGEIFFFDRIWIPSVGGVRKLIMDEAHTSRYSVHPGADMIWDTHLPLIEFSIRTDTTQALMCTIRGLYRAVNVDPPVIMAQKVWRKSAYWTRDCSKKNTE